MLFDSIWALFLGKHVADIYRHAVESPNQGRAAQEIKRREKGRECFKYAELPATDRRPTLTAPLSLSLFKSCRYSKNMPLDYKIQNH